MDINQTTLIWVFRIIYLLITLLLSWGIWQFMRQDKFIETRSGKPYQPPKINLPSKSIILSLITRPGRYYQSQKLFDILYNLGFHFSTQNFFEYYLPDQKTIAFYIINIQNSGTFTKKPEDMHPTNGLLVIMQLPVLDGSNQTKYFHLLLSIMDTLQNELDAVICDQDKRPIKNEKLYQIEKEIEAFEQNYCTLIQNDYQSKILQ